MRTSPYTAMAAAPGTQYSGLANLMAMQGSEGDNTLVHMSKSELPYLNNLARAAGHPQGLPVNPKTGLPEANILKSILPIAGTILGTMFLGPGIGTAIGSQIGGAALGAGLGSFGGSLLAGRSLKDAAIGGLISGGLSGLSAGMFGGAEGSLGGNPGTVGTAGKDIVGPSLNAMPGGGSSIVEGAQLGAFGMPEFAGGSNLLTTTGGGTGLGTAGSAIANSQVQALAPAYDTPVGMSNLANPAGAFPTGDYYAPDFAQQLSDSGMGSINTTPAPVPTKDAIASAYRDKYNFGKDFTGKSLREGYTGTAKDLKAIQDMSEPSYLSRIQPYNSEGPLTRMDFLKTQFKPAATQAGAMLGIDALTEQGAFEPIDYSGYPTGEENKVSPLPLRGLKFESERTGAFPTTAAQALAFAQPGGAPRQRFFNQRFTIPARTGGGVAALISKGPEPFQEGGLTALEVALSDGDGSGTGTGPGGAAPSNSVAEADTGFGFGIGQGTNSGVDAANAANTAASIAGLGMGVPGLGAVASGLAQAGQYASIPEAQRGSLQFSFPSLFGLAPTIAQQHTNLTTQRELDIDPAAEEEAEAQASFNAAMGLASLAMAAEEAPEDIAAVAEVAEAAEAASAPGGGESTGGGHDIGGGGSFGGDDTGPDSSGDGSPSDTGDDPGGPFQQGGYLGAIEMASGGDLKDIMGFLSPAYGLGRAVKKEGLEGLMAHLSPAFAMSQGKLPMGLDSLMGSKAPAPAPAARSTEAPVQAGPAPTIDELEELQNVAVMQQVLAGQPVEAQMGGLVSTFAMGGMPSPYFEGRVVGPGDGMSDSIPFSIEGQQPAILSRDEYVLPADIVSMMGNGSSDAGAGKIDSFINDFRVQKYGRGEQPPETNKGLSSIG
tara:strand:- start:893 stop:3547 length:2655 start_codon:yes stop_codon:yes gene_type:complete